jgi:hypothetical protein
MDSPIFTGLALLTIVLSLNSGLSAASEKYLQVQYEGLSLTLSLEKHTETVEKAEWPAEPVQLTSQSVPVNGKTIHELLQAANIFPDVDAFNVVYTLNPDLKDLRKLAVAQIRIPKVTRGPKLDAMFAQGFQVTFTVEKEKKQQFNDNAQKLATLRESISQLKADKFESQIIRDEFINRLNRSSQILEDIAEQVREKDGRPIPRIVLIELNGEAQFLVQLLAVKAEGNAKFDQEDLKKIKDLEIDLERKSRAFVEVAAAGDPSTQYPTVDVFVKTVQQSGGLVRGLRVWYAPKLAKQDLHSFGLLTTDKENSPVQEKIFEGDYCFWAAKDPGQTPVTNEQCQKLYLNNKVELTVNK